MKSTQKIKLYDSDSEIILAYLDQLDSDLRNDKTIDEASTWANVFNKQGNRTTDHLKISALTQRGVFDQAGNFTNDPNIARPPYTDERRMITYREMNFPNTLSEREKIAFNGVYFKAGSDAKNIVSPPGMDSNEKQAKKRGQKNLRIDYISEAVGVQLSNVIGFQKGQLIVNASTKNKIRDIRDNMEFVNAYVQSSIKRDEILQDLMKKIVDVIGEKEFLRIINPEGSLIKISLKDVFNIQSISSIESLKNKLKLPQIQSAIDTNPDLKKINALYLELDNLIKILKPNPNHPNPSDERLKDFYTAFQERNLDYIQKTNRVTRLIQSDPLNKLWESKIKPQAKSLPPIEVKVKQKVVDKSTQEQVKTIKKLKTMPVYSVNDLFEKYLDQLAVNTRTPSNVANAISVAQIFKGNTTLSDLDGNQSFDEFGQHAKEIPFRDSQRMQKVMSNFPTRMNDRDKIGFYGVMFSACSQVTEQYSMSKYESNDKNRKSHDFNNKTLAYINQFLEKELSDSMHFLPDRLIPLCLKNE